MEPISSGPLPRSAMVITGALRRTAAATPNVSAMAVMTLQRLPSIKLQMSACRMRGDPTSRPPSVCLLLLTVIVIVV
jgi:hypothetical protein